MIQKKKKTELKLNRLQHGFSILEIAIILALLGLLGAFVVPNLFRTKQGAQRKEFLTSFEHLIKDAMLRAIVTHETHQIFIDIAHGVIQTRVYDSRSIETNKHKKFAVVSDSQYLTELPSKDQKNIDLKRFHFQNFYINGIEEMVAGTFMENVMFYIMPDGTSQAIVANLIDQDPDEIVPDVQFSFVINPFYTRMSVYDTFQTP